MSQLIEFKSVSKTFSETLLINSVSFTIARGGITTLIGPNGAGKTTIARLILGLDSPSDGQIKVAPSLKIEYVPQKLDFRANLPITVWNFLNLLAPNHHKEDFEEFASFIDFESIKHKDISKISGGQIQKLMLVSTLLNKPDLIILDEPTKSLDVSSQQEFYRLINQVKSRLNLTIFMISHDLFTVIKTSDQVICLNGHICCSGKPSDLNNNQDFLDTLSLLGFYAHHHDHKH